MTLQARIESTRNQYHAIHRDLTKVEGMAHPQCQTCGGNGFYKVSVEKWYELVAKELQKKCEPICPIDVFYAYQPNGITVVCDCIEYEQSRIARNLHSTLQNLERTKKWIDGSIGTEYADKTYEKYNWQYPAHKAIFEDWMKTPKSLYIHGVTHKGKTHLLSCCVQHLATRSVIIIQYSDLMSIASDMSNLSSRSAFIDQLCFAEWLLIDDIGTGGRLTPERHNVVKTIFDYRVGNGKPFVLTSEHSPEKIFENAEMTTDNLRWRIIHGATVLNLNGAHR